MKFLTKEKTYNYTFISTILFITNIIIIPITINNPLSVKWLLILYVIVGFLSLLFLIYIFIKNNIYNENIKIDSKLYKLYDYIAPLMVTLSIFVIIFGNIIVLGEVSQSSMEPTLQNKQKILIYKYCYTPKRDDIVIVLDEDLFDSPIIKRVVAVPGDKITFVEKPFTIDNKGYLYINDVLYKNAFLKNKETLFTQVQFNKIVEHELSNGIFQYEVTLSEGYYIVLGDYFDISMDSRHYGAFHQSKIIGKMIYP
ncbi:MAG: signal peptidase I [Acholeplasmataceae bacterium]|jgi:signal peptidase I